VILAIGYVPPLVNPTGAVLPLWFVVPFCVVLLVILIAVIRG
jgi:hypothetical protein